MQNCNFSDKFVSEAGLKILILSAGMDACHRFTLSQPSPRGINYSVDHNLGKKSIELIGEECGDSPKQVQRYIKITELIPELLEKVDDGSMGFTPAVQLSFLKKKEQKEMLDAMEFAQCTPSYQQTLSGWISPNCAKRVCWRKGYQMKTQLIDFGGRSPERAHANDAGADVFSPKDAVIRPGDICKLPLGFGCQS